MKNLVFSMLAMAAMVSCTSESSPIDEVDNGQPAEIKLNAGVVTTKAAIDNNFSTDFNVQFYRPEDAADADVSWSSGSVLHATVAGAAGHAITFKKSSLDATPIKQYYNSDVTKKSWLAGCYLGENASETITNGQVTITIDGTKDIMATKGQSGTKTTAFPNFEFIHMLSQVEVKLIGDVAAQQYFGNVTSIKITNIATTLDLTLGTNPSIEKNASATADQEISIYNNPTGEALTPTGITISNIPMIYQTGTTIQLEIASKNVSKSTVTANLTSNIEAGKKHVITLTFKEKIEATATVKQWETGATGTGDVE